MCLSVCVCVCVDGVCVCVCVYAYVDSVNKDLQFDCIQTSLVELYPNICVWDLSKDLSFCHIRRSGLY